jgi:hypothetical protein
MMILGNARESNRYFRMCEELCCISDSLKTDDGVGQHKHAGRETNRLGGLPAFLV